MVFPLSSGGNCEMDSIDVRKVKQSKNPSRSFYS